MPERRWTFHLITDRVRTAAPGGPGNQGGGEDALVEAVAAALAGGVDWVQVRDKGAAADELLRTVQAVQAVAGPLGKGVLVNDRLDVALAAGAAGVHLARKSLPPHLARRVAGDGLLVGASVHSVEQAIAAAEAGVDYVTFGHVFPTRSKPGLPPRGPEALREVVEAVDIPVLAIGGITADRVPLVLATGCAGIAVIGAVLSEADPHRAAQRLRDALDSTPGRPRHPFPPAPSSQHRRP